LWEKNGILIRDASNFRGLDETYIRLSTQTSAENQILIDAIREWFAQL
jgi:threonine-phosphate decarboxylase